MAGEGRREVLKLAAAAALGAAGVAGAATFQAVRGQGRPAGQFDVVSYGADPSGKSDSAAAIQRAIDDASRSRGGLVLFPTGSYLCAHPLSADRSTGVRLQGAGAETISAERVAMLRYGGGGGHAFISARSTAGFGLSGLGVVYESRAFTGFVVDLSGRADDDNTVFARVEDCVIEGAGLNGARALICLDRATISTVTNCNLGNAQTAILGRVAPDRYSNAIQIRSCQFINTATAPITNPGEAWLVEGCTFEALSGGHAGAISCQLAARALSVVGCWMGDVAEATGSVWIEFQGNGLQVAGNLIGGSPNTVGIQFVGGDNAGIDVRGNAFDTHAIGVDLGPGQRGVTILANAFTGVPVPVSGQTTPTTTVQLDAWPEGPRGVDRGLSAVQELEARLRRLESRA